MKRDDFFEYYKRAKNSEIKMDETTVKIYEELFYEAEKFFRKTDKVFGTAFWNEFKPLYIDGTADNGKAKNLNAEFSGEFDNVAYDKGIHPRTLNRHRLIFDAFGLSTLKDMGYKVIALDIFCPVKFVKDDV